MELKLEGITKSYTKGKKRKNGLEDFTLTLTEGVYGPVSYTHLDVYKRQKEDLVPIIGDENMIQEMPEEFNKVLEVQRSWQK